MTEARRGLLLGLAGYVMWGVFPLYWTLLEPAGAVELLAHRVVWSAITMVVVVLLVRRRDRLVAVLRSRRAMGYLAVAAVAISVNWGVFIWAVNNDHVVETSLGYFINPLVTVLAGVLVLGEKLRRLQWVAVGVAAVAVAGLTIDYGRPPYVALTLAFSFGLYGLVRKQADVGAAEGLTVETLLVGPLALGYLVWLGADGGSHFLVDAPWHPLLFVSTGVVTALPLVCFGAAATRIPLSQLGLLQYLTPTLHLILGLTFFGEPMPLGRLIGFMGIWVALAIFTVDTLRAQRLLRLQLQAAAV